MPTLDITVRAETWPLAEAFVIARGAKTEAAVVVVGIGDDLASGRGESVPYARYGETVAGVIAAIEGAAVALQQYPSSTAGELRARLAVILPAGAARNALDCALWDYEAKATGSTVAALAGCPPPSPLLTAFTLSLDTAEAMAAKARAVPHLPLLKLKLGGDGDEPRLRAVRSARPDARLIADANEAWTAEMLGPLLAVCRQTRVELVEQPLPAGGDDALAARPAGVAICADESLHTRADLARLAARYDAINIKLDKAGGLTEALALAHAARALGLDVMVGCMVATSLAMAPALLVASSARWVDLDGPLLLVRDRSPGLAIANGVITQPGPGLWG